MDSEMLFDTLDYDPLVVAEIRSLRSGYSACGINHIYKIMNASKSYRIFVSAEETVKKRLFHDVVRSILVCNMLSELFNGPEMDLRVYYALEDVKGDFILLCEEYIEFFATRFLPHPKHKKCISLFEHIIESLVSESRVDVGKAFEILE
jgi:predicted nucleotidyltransferase